MPDESVAGTTDELVRRRLLWPIDEAALQLGMSKRTLRRREVAGDLRVVRVGRRKYVSDKELQRFVANLEAAAS